MKTTEATEDTTLMPAADAESAGNPTALETPDKTIRIRAFEIFVERGADHGADVDDWLQAERELNGVLHVAMASERVA